MLLILFFFKLVLGSPCHQEENSLTLPITSVNEMPVPGELERCGGSAEELQWLCNLHYICWISSGISNLHEYNWNWFPDLMQVVQEVQWVLLLGQSSLFWVR